MNFNDLNKAFDNRIRLGLMSALAVNDELNFNTLKELLQITDGNLASHLRSLEENGYVRFRKGFIGRKTNTVYSITCEGEIAFKEHLQLLEKIIQDVR